MKKQFILIYFLFTGFGLLSQIPSDGYISSSNFYEEIPITLIKGKILIPVVIQGDTFSFIFDTGGALDLSADIQKKFAFKRLGSASVGGINGMRKRYDYVSVPEVSIGKIRFKNFPGLVSSIYELDGLRCMDAQGLIGRDFLQGLCVQFDLPNRRLIITDQPENLKLGGAQPIPFYIEKKTGLPYFKVRLNEKQKLDICFDSGSRKFFSFETKTIEKLRQKKKISSDKVGVLTSNSSLGITGKIPVPAPSYMLDVDQLVLGDHTFKNFTSDPSLKSRSRFGTGLLMLGQLTIDYKNQNAYYLPYEDQSILHPISPLGFEVRFRDGNLQVTGVLKDGVAGRAGIINGDIIRQADRTDFRNIDPTDCGTLLREFSWLKATHLKLVVWNKRDGERSLNLSLTP